MLIFIVVEGGVDIFLIIVCILNRKFVLSCNLQYNKTAQTIINQPEFWGDLRKRIYHARQSNCHRLYERAVIR